MLSVGINGYIQVPATSRTVVVIILMVIAVIIGTRFLKSITKLHSVGAVRSIGFYRIYSKFNSRESRLFSNEITIRFVILIRV